MTVDELMKPRYKVIAPMPFSNFKVGDILMQGMVQWQIDKDAELMWRRISGEDHSAGMSVRIPIIRNPEDYPHLFSPLPWYAERKPEDMDNLDYLKDIGDGEIFQAECLNNGMCYVKPNNPKEGDLRYTSLEHFLPATSTQYIEYMKSKQKA